MASIWMVGCTLWIKLRGRSGWTSWIRLSGALFPFFFLTSSRLVTADLTNFKSNNLFLIDIIFALCFSPASWCICSCEMGVRGFHLFKGWLTSAHRLCLRAEDTMQSSKLLKYQRRWNCFALALVGAATREDSSTGSTLNMQRLSERTPMMKHDWIRLKHYKGLDDISSTCPLCPG